MKQVRSQAVANELLTYVIFLLVLFIISYANRDADSFKIKNHIGKYILGKDKTVYFYLWDPQVCISLFLSVSKNVDYLFFKLKKLFVVFYSEI